MQCIELNRLFAERVKGSELLELMTPPMFALSVFRMKAPADGGSLLASPDVLTRRLWERVSARSDIYLTQTVLQGMFCIRLAVGAARTDVRHIEAAYQLLCEEAKQTLIDISASEQESV